MALPPRRLRALSGRGQRSRQADRARRQAEHRSATRPPDLRGHRRQHVLKSNGFTPSLTTLVHLSRARGSPQGSPTVAARWALGKPVRAPAGPPVKKRRLKRRTVAGACLNRHRLAFRRDRPGPLSARTEYCEKEIAKTKSRKREIGGVAPQPHRRPRRQRVAPVAIRSQGISIANCPSLQRPSRPEPE
jgi:hypothetical protein